MLRILGYNKSETAKLYMMSTTIATVISVLLSLGIAAVVFAGALRLFYAGTGRLADLLCGPGKLCVGSCTGNGIIRCFSGVTVSQNRKSRLRSKDSRGQIYKTTLQCLNC